MTTTADYLQGMFELCAEWMNDTAEPGQVPTARETLAAFEDATGVELTADERDYLTPRLADVSRAIESSGPAPW